MIFRSGYDWWGVALERLLGVLMYHMGTDWYACSLVGFRGWVVILQCVVIEPSRVDEIEEGRGWAAC